MKEVVDLTKELIRFQTVKTRPDELARCAAFIEEYLKKRGAAVQRHDHDGILSISALSKDDRCPVLLMSHFDVVDGPAHLFTPVEKDGKLYGRGAIDDKYAVALSMVLFCEHLQRLQEQGKNQDDLPVGILITGDEEIGGANGALKILPQIKADFAIALDGGDLGKIVVKSKGLLEVKMIARGKSAHGARPWMGENAIEKLIDDYLKIRVLFQKTDPEHWHRTLNFSVVQAGGSVNRVPDYAEAVFDIRYTENDDVDDLLQRMGSCIEGELILEKREPMFYGGQSQYLDLLLEIAGDTRTGQEHGASDARFLSRYSIPGIVWGAEGDKSQHSEDEHLNLESVSHLYDLLDTFLLNLADR
jgi:succinyl-diaminopimelate desuccinylase